MHFTLHTKKNSRGIDWRDMRGISLIETLIASGIFVLAVSSLGLMGFSGVDLARVGGERMEALRFAEEGIEAARAIRAQDFAQLTPGPHGIATSSSGWVFSGAEDRRNDLVRHVDITPLSAGRARLDVHVARQKAGPESEVLLSTYLHDIFASSWTQTSVSDFTAGGNNGTEVLTSSGDGAVGLRIAGDWAAPKTLVNTDLTATVAVRALRESGGTLFAGTSVNGEELALYDLSNVSAGILPRLRTANIGADVNATAISGGYAYLATAGDTRELTVVRIKDGVVVNQLDLTGTADALSVVATGTKLYLGRVSSAQPEVYEINISTPEGALPLLRTLQYAGDVTALIFGPSGHLLGASTGVEVFAVNMGTFTVVSSLDLSGGADAQALALSGNTLYVARLSSSAEELATVDVSNPAVSMTFMSGAQLSGSVYDVSVGADGMIAVATGIAAREVALFQPNLTPIGTFDVSAASGARSVLIRGAYIYTGMNLADPELVVLRGGNGSWEAPTITGGYDAPGNPDGLAAWSLGTRAYLGTANNGSGNEFSILDVTDPANPTLLGSLDIGAAVNDIVVSGTYAYLATENTSRELTVVNIANPALPAIIGSYNVVGNISATSLVASGTMIYLGTKNNSAATGRELYAITVSTPSLPVLSGSFEVGADVNALARKGALLLLATASDAKELLVVDGTFPAVMTEIASYDTPNTGDGLAVSWTDNAGGFLSLGTQNNGAGSDYYQFTLATNGAPILKSFLDLGEDNNHIALSSDIAFVGNNKSGGGLAMLNVENPSAPLLLSTVAIGGVGNGVFALPQTAYLANSLNSREFTIVRPASVPTLRPKESWFTSSTFDAGSAVALQTISWTASGTGTVKFQLRTASSQAGLLSAMWVGPDGTPDTLYTISGTAVVLDPLRTGTQWINYRATLEGNSATTPILEDVRVTYN